MRRVLRDVFRRGRHQIPDAADVDNVDGVDVREREDRKAAMHRNEMERLNHSEEKVTKAVFKAG